MVRILVKNKKLRNKMRRLLLLYPSGKELKKRIDRQRKIEIKKLVTWNGGVEKKVTVQMICRVCKNEKDVRFVLDEIGQKPLEAQEILVKTLDLNQTVFEFEKILTC